MFYQSLLYGNALFIPLFYSTYKFLLRKGSNNVIAFSKFCVLVTSAYLYYEFVKIFYNVFLLVIEI